MTHRKTFILAMVLTVVSLLVTQCAPAPAVAPTAMPQPTSAPPPTSAPVPTTAPKPTTAPTQAPSSGAASTLVIVIDTSDMISLDPAVAYEFTDDLIVHQAYETLVRFEGADLSVLKPGLAQTWAIKDAGDHWELTFNLRPNAKFASGNPVTADDVVYSFQRVLSLNKSPAFLFSDIAQLKPDSIKATDPQTVVISLPKTASPQGFLAILTFSVGSVVDSKVVKSHEQSNDFGSAWLLDRSSGGGPYVIDHWQKEAEVLLKANPNYAGAKPALASILFKHVPEATNQRAALEKGDADIARNLSPEQVVALKGNSAISILKGDNLQLVYVGMNATVKPLDNVKVREALRTAVDYDGIVNDLLGGIGGKKVQDIIPSGLAGFNAAMPFQQNIDQAKALLKDAGQDKGFTLELLVPTGPAPGGVAWADLAAKLQADWAKIGVTVNIKQTTQAELLGTYRAQKGQLVLILWGPDFPDPDANVGPFTDYNAKSIAFRNAWQDSISDKARAAALITDPAQRAAAYKDITDYVLHNGPYVILYQASENFGLRSNVKGLVWSPIGWADLWSVSK